MSDLQTFTVWFTEETFFRVVIDASSPLDAAKKVKARWDEEGNENMQDESTEAKDFAVYDHKRQVTDILDDQLDDEEEVAE